MAIRSIFAKVTAETSGFQKGMRDAAKSVSPFQQAVSGLKGIGGTLNLLRGAGAFAGISIAAREATQALNSFSEAMQKIETGEMTWGETLRDAFREFPIVGPLGQAWRGITGKGQQERREMIDALRQEVEAQRAIIEQERKLSEKNKPFKDAADAARKELNRLNLGERGALIFELGIKGVESWKIEKLEEIWKRIDWFKARDAMREAREEARKFAAEGIKSLQDRGKQLADSIRTPAMQFKDATDELVQVFGAGGFGFTPDAINTFNAVTAKLRKDIFPARQGRTFGREIDLTREFIGEGSGPKKQNVEDAQLKVTNRLLQDILRQKGGTARVGP